MEAKLNHSNGVEAMFKVSEFNRFGLISMIILIVGCLGGVAVGMGAITHVATLALVIIPTMTTLSLLLSVSPMKWILPAALFCVVTDIVLITFYAFN